MAGSYSHLREALVLLLRSGSVLLAPPGSEAGLGVLMGLGGVELGLAMPTRISMVAVFRDLVADGPFAFLSGLGALPRPQPALIVVFVLMALGVMGLSGGWINVALALVQGKPVTERTWSDGLKATTRVLAWHLVVLAWLILVCLIGWQVGWFAIHSGLAASGSTGDLVMPTLWGLGGLTLWALALGAAVYYLAVTCLGAVVAVAEPDLSLWALLQRAPAVFLSAAGWRGVGELLLLLGTWWAFKAVCSQLLVPYLALPLGPSSQIYGAAGALLWASLAAGNGLVLLVVVLMGALAYCRNRGSLHSSQEK